VKIYVMFHVVCTGGNKKCMQYLGWRVPRQKTVAGRNNKLGYGSHK